MSGCAVCVYDLYDEARNDYIQALGKLRLDLAKLGVPESDWPADVQANEKNDQLNPVSKPNVTLSAFEQLEQALKAKRETTTSASPNSTESDPQDRLEC